MTPRELESALVGYNRAHVMFRCYKRIPRPIPVDHTFFGTEPGVYLSLGYALLFPVLEFLHRKNAMPEDIAAEVDELYPQLKLFRNGIFHLQDKVFSEKHLSILRNKEAITSVRKVEVVVGKYLLDLRDANR
jgi:hypothetical protein